MVLLAVSSVPKSKSPREANYERCGLVRLAKKRGAQRASDEDDERLAHNTFYIDHN